ncbi:MAG: two-component system, OmpR family, response regulator VicR [Clostridiales bacterium]|jgi:DNA-binding response OmpR family regulator|nr:two-component system, OmpR family, response regulator VicR [Clostridiales bacterium]
MKFLIPIEDLNSNYDTALNVYIPHAHHELVISNLKLDMKKHRVRVSEEDLDLTRLEFEVLTCLLLYPHTAVSRQALIQFAWKNPSRVEKRAVDDTIKRIRDKLKGRETSVQILTKRNHGFVITDQDEQPFA